jgi:hypothetical protein
LPRPDDHSDGSSTLPPPELNPLLNPILAQNMGRWAEVYFTSPPEKREQAVLDLLRELQGDNPEPEVNAPSPVSEQESRAITAPTSRPEEVPVAVVHCQACGRENPGSHRFCGMCGTPVGEQRAAADLNITDLHVADFPVADFQRADMAREDRPGQDRPSDDRRVAHLFAEDPAPLAPRSEERTGPSINPVSEPAWNTGEFLSARGAREFDDRDDRTSNLFESAPPSRPYGLYAGIAVVVVLALAYVAWRSMQTSPSSSQGSRVASQAPPVVTTEPAASSPATTLAKADSPQPIPDRTAEVASPANTQAAVPANSAEDPRRADPLPDSAKAKPSPDAAAQAASPIGAIDGKNLEAEPVSANGEQELAIAQRYLSGAEGQERNSAEGAKWLWKAIAKHNADATLLLSDLYLKGDGVEKNCDQARVLLDAAAGRGLKGAGDRLRHLQAFGCQ